VLSRCLAGLIAVELQFSGGSYDVGASPLKHKKWLLCLERGRNVSHCGVWRVGKIKRGKGSGAKGKCLGTGVERSCHRNTASLPKLLLCHHIP
jgi:hypothetical protein